MHEGDGQSVPSLPPRWRLLADVGASRLDAEALDVARRPVRHLAPAPHQDRRPRRRNEDDDPSALADLLPRSGYSAFRSRTHTAPRHLNDGARGPTTIHNPSFNPQTRSNQNSGPKPERNRCAHSTKNHPNIPKHPPEPSAPCIMPANSAYETNYTVAVMIAANGGYDPSRHAALRNASPSPPSCSL